MSERSRETAAEPDPRPAGEDRRLAYAAWLAVCFFWGTTYLAIRVGVQVAPPLLFNGMRVLAAGVLLMTWLRARGQELPTRTDWLHLGIVGTALLGIGNGFVSWSAQWVPSGLAAISVATTPFWMVGVEALRPGGDRPTWNALAGMVLGCCGMALLVAPRLQAAHLDTGVLLGFAGLQVACASWSAGSIYSRYRPVPVSPLMGAAAQMIVGGCLVSLTGILLGEGGRLACTPQGLAAFLYLLVFGSLVGYAAYIYALQKLPVSTVSLYAYVNPVIAMALGAALLGETLTVREIAAAAVILGGVAVVRSRPASPPEET